MAPLLVREPIVLPPPPLQLLMLRRETGLAAEEEEAQVVQVVVEEEMETVVDTPGYLRATHPPHALVVDAAIGRLTRPPGGGDGGGGGGDDPDDDDLSGYHTADVSERNARRLARADGPWRAKYKET